MGCRRYGKAAARPTQLRGPNPPETLMRMWPSIACNVQTQYCTVWEMKLGTVQPTHTQNEAASHLDAECAAATGSLCSLRRKFWRPAKLLAASEVLAAKHSSELHLVRASSRAEDLGEGSCAADRSAWRLTVVGWGRGEGGNLRCRHDSSRAQQCALPSVRRGAFPWLAARLAMSQFCFSPTPRMVG